MRALDPPVHPVWVDALVADVDRAFAVTDAATPGWPDPHPDRDPAEEEYSRCLDPGKYRILGARVDAWVRVLKDRGVATVLDEDVAGLDWLDAVRAPTHPHRVRRLAPARTDGLVLLLATTLVDGAPFGLDIGITQPGSPVVFVDMVPDCGCDACDSGSADLLEVLDGWVLTVARGGVVHARRGSSHITRTFDGWQGTGRVPAAWLDASSPAPTGVRRWQGAPWL